MSTRAIRTRRKTTTATRDTGKAAGPPVPRAVIDGLLGLVCERLDHGLLMLDPDLAVVAGTPSARRALGAGDGIVVRSGRFTFTDPDAQRRFSALVTLAGEAGETPPPSLGLRVRRRYGLACRAVVTPVGNRLEHWNVAYVVLICGLGGTREIAPSVLREVYDLTRAQTDVAASLYGGLSVEQTAGALGLSLNTVRSHLKKIFAKCGVGSQAELMQMLALGPHAL